jgi:hypothetical protein
VAVRQLLGEARATADRLDQDRNDFWTAFGPTNVALHEVSIAPGRRLRVQAVLPQPDTAAGVWVAAEPDTADAVAVRCRRNRGQCPDGWPVPDGWCPPRTLPQLVGVRCYRNRSPGRRPLHGCRHCRYARVSWRWSRSPSCART